MSDKIENIDVAFNSIIEAVEEYNDFILGIPDGDVITSIMGGKGHETPENVLEERDIRKVLSQISDRTNGGCSMYDIDTVASKVWGSGENIAKSVWEYVSVFHISSEAGPPDYFTKSGLDIPEGSLALNHLNYLSSEGEIRHVLKYGDPKRFSERTVIIGRSTATEDDSTVENEEGEQERTVRIPSGSFFGEDLSETAPESLNQSAVDFNKESPSLGAVVFKNPKHGFNSRSANHMPIFLSAISPVEMSRCTPYLDVKILSKQKTPYSKMGIMNFIRARDTEKEVKGSFFNPEPVSEEPTDFVDGGVSFDYMNLFTSPQTMVNANINREWFGEDLEDVKNSFAQFSEDSPARTSGQFTYSSVTDPMQPFMTLLSFNVSVSGVGHGLLATKKASLKVKLHDKSRIKDISALLSPKEFGSTKFIIEFGWSHPDASPVSTNTLGKYLNALRDSSVYQLVNADYNFGDDNSVDITLNLVCTGFNQLSSISAAAGKYVNLNSIIDELDEEIQLFINDLVDDYKGTNKKSVNEIRGTLKLTNNDLSKNSLLVPFEDFAAWKKLSYEMRALYTYNSSTPSSDGIGVSYDSGARTDYLSAFFKLIYGVDLNGDVPTIEKILDGGPEYVSDLFTLIDQKTNRPNAGDIIIAKMRSLPYGNDPFRGQVAANHMEYAKDLLDKSNPNESSFGADAKLIGSVNEGVSYNSYNDQFSSLGKIITSFVGYPMSTCGLYDEVQLFFYPVNSHCAAARKHTTASLPIKISDLEEQIKKRILASEQAFRDLSVRGFFSMLERIVSNIAIAAYGLYTPGDGSVYSQLQEFKEASREKKLEILTKDEPFQNSSELLEAESAAVDEIQEQQDASEDDVSSEIQQEYLENKQIQTYESYLAQKVSSEKEEKLRAIYESESTGDNVSIEQGYLDPYKFTPINLSMYFETFPMKARALSDSLDDAANFGDYLKSLIGVGRRDLNSKGINYGKTGLRIHIYDENTVTDPNVSLYGSNFQNVLEPDEDFMKNINSYDILKSIMTHNHPTIIHGASTGVVNSIRVSSNTSSTLSNILLVESYGQSLQSETDGDPDEGFDETVLLPTTVNLEMMGFPMLSRGQQIFIDFGTGTSLDNLYMVKTVDHTVEAGSFKTSAILTASNQMVLTSLRSKLKKMISGLGGG